MEEYIPENQRNYNDYPTNNPKNDEQKNRSFFNESALNNTLPMWEKIIFFVLGWLGFKFLSLVVQVILSPLYKAVGSNMFSCILMLVVYGLMAIFFAIFFIVDKKAGKALINDFKDYKAMLLGVGICFLLLFVNAIISSIYSKAFPNIYGANSNQSGLNTEVATSPVMLFFPIVLFAPFTEELTYRVGLVDTFGHKKRWLGVLISALIFGLIHFSFESILLYANYDGLLAQGYSSLIKGYDAIGEAIYYTKNEMYIQMINEFLNLPIYILAGLIFGFGYAYTGKISTSMTAHVVNNLLSYVSILISLNASTSSQAVNMFRVFIK